MVIVGEDFLQRKNAGNGERNLRDDERLTGDGSERLQTDRASDAHRGQEGGDQVAVVLVLLVAAGRLRLLAHIEADDVGAQELLHLVQQGTVDGGQAAHRTGIVQQRDGHVFGLVLLHQRDSIEQWDGFLEEIW